MKKFILILFFSPLLAAVTINAQQLKFNDCTNSSEFSTKHETYPVLLSTADTTKYTKADLLMKQHNQQTLGWVMLGGGVVMAITGGLIVSNNFQLFSNENDGATIGGSVLFLVGVGSAIGSIPVFVKAAKNGRKAAAIGIAQQKVTSLVNKNIASTTQVAVSLKIHY